jgi:hypothetical protein
VLIFHVCCQYLIKFSRYLVKGAGRLARPWEVEAAAATPEGVLNYYATSAAAAPAVATTALPMAMPRQQRQRNYYADGLVNYYADGDAPTALPMAMPRLQRTGKLGNVQVLLLKDCAVGSAGSVMSMNLAEFRNVVERKGWNPIGDIIN